MTKTDDFDARLSAEVNHFADEIASELDPERVADAAMAHREASLLPVAVTAMAAVLLAAAATSALAFSSQLPLGESVASSVPSQSADSTPDPTPDPTASPSAVLGLSEAEAIVAARAAAPESVGQPVVAAYAGPAQDLLQPLSSYASSSRVEPDQWIWVVVTDSGGELDGEGTIVVLDFITGEAYEVIKTRG